MKDKKNPEPAAAGVLLAIAILVGTTIGMIVREPSAGVVGGAAFGGVSAVIYWLRDRKRVGR